MSIFLFQICIMPFWVIFERCTMNYNGVDIFDDYQIGCISFRIYKSKETKIKWQLKHF
jgi:hypothetical protein